MAQSVKNLPAMQETACNAEVAGLIPGWGRFAGGGHGNPLQYSCVENPHGQATVYRVTKESDMTE